MNDLIYVIVFVIITIGITILVKYMKKNNTLNQDDLLSVMNVLDLSMTLVDQLDLKNEQKIKQISEIVILSLNYAIQNYNSPEQILKSAQQYGYDLFDKFDIELTENRKALLDKLLTIGLQNKFVQTPSGFIKK